MRTGKLDSFLTAEFDKEGEPKKDRSIQVDLGEKFSFEMWKTLICDEKRDSIWIGSEDGELAQFLATEQKVEQVRCRRCLLFLWLRR